MRHDRALHTREAPLRRVRLPGQRRVLGVLLGAVFIRILENDNLHVVLTFWYLFLLIQIAFIRRARLGALIFVSLTLYATTAWLALKYAREVFPPWPSAQLVAETTLLDFRCVIWAYIVSELVLGMESITAGIQRATAKYQSFIHWQGTRSLDIAVALFVLLIGLYDCLQIAIIGLGNILGSERRAYANELLMGGNHNIQVLCAAATIWLVSRFVLVHKSRLSVLAMLTLWIPFFMVGSRKEAITTAAVLAILIGAKMSRRVIGICALGGVAVFLMPALGTGNIYSSLHEFILPQYMHFSLAMGLVPEDLGGSFWERSQFLLPSFMRFTEVLDLGRAFYMLDLAGVGVGASPFAEAGLMNLMQSTEFSFVVLFVAILFIMIASSYFWPGLTCTVYGLILVYGRSDFWTFMFFAVYISLLLWLIRRFGVLIRKKGDSSLPLSRPRGGGAGPSVNT